MFDIIATAKGTFHLGLTICKTIAMYIITAKDVVSFIIDTNYNVVSFVFGFVSSLCCATFSAATYIGTSVIHFLQSCYEFMFEIVLCLKAIVLFIWKVFILVYKIVNLAVAGAEVILVYIYTGSFSTATAVKQSALDIVNNFTTLWNYGIEIIQNLLNAVVGGFSIIGNVVIYILKTIWWSLGFVFASVLSILYSSYNYLYNIWNILVNTFNKTFTLSKEVYLGIIICCFIYLVISNCISFIMSHGIPFRHALWPRTRPRRTQYDYDIGFESDVEIVDPEAVEEEDEYESDSSHSSTNNSENTDSENQISDDDDDDDGSVNSQTFSSDSDQEIEINLPEPPTQGYSLRSRSSTPSRLKNLTLEDFAYEIEKEKDKRKCVVCQDRSKCVLVLPCRHMCLCVECTNHIVRSTYAVRRVCPLCRQSIEKVMNVYV